MSDLSVLHHEPDAALWSGPLLCVSHTARPVELERCDLNFLTNRYADPDRLARLPERVPFDSLSPSIAHSPHRGAITVWRFADHDFTRPTLLAHLAPRDYHPQHAIWWRDRLWVLGVEVLEAYDAQLQRVAVIEDPWLAGAHTLAPDGDGRLVVSCSASDAVLVIDPDAGRVERALRLPESLYGHNYPLTRDHSVVEHYIPNDLQLTHVNAGWPHAGGILVSTLIQGAIGWFAPDGRYRELTRGFVGCHGIRSDHAGRLYFCDSCMGAVVFLDAPLDNTATNGRPTIARRIATGSRWLHDALELAPHVLALNVADRNAVVILEAREAEPIHTIDCHPFGESIQFLSFGG